jgi:hypothetical protein
MHYVTNRYVTTRVTLPLCGASSQESAAPAACTSAVRVFVDDCAAHAGAVHPPYEPPVGS